MAIAKVIMQELVRPHLLAASACVPLQFVTLHVERRTICQFVLVAAATALHYQAVAADR